jgi:hypothetical protein
MPIRGAADCSNDIDLMFDFLVEEINERYD